MGRIQKGVLGGFSGTVGTVVGSNWNGIEVMRSKPTVNKNRTPTQKQLEQQARFAVGIGFARTINDLLMETYSGYAKQMTGANAALSKILKKQITGTYPSFTIAYNQVSISRGPLPGAETAVASGGVPGAIGFSWTNIESGIGKAKPTDQALLVAYCPENNRAVYRKGALRSMLNDTLSVNGFRNKVVQTWLTFVSEDGYLIADSIFTGEIIVTDIQVI
jgi:hypothetical protein